MSTTRLQHPKGLYLLGFAEAWDRISYYGIQAILILYLTEKYLFTDYHAYALFGIYSALGFATPVLGGYIADRYLGLRESILLGMLFIIAGNVILLTHSPSLFFIGLAFLVLGIGLFKGNAATQLGLCYQTKEALRSSGFSLLYVAMNLGSIVGPILFGLSGIAFGCHFAFIASGLGMLIAASLYCLHYRYFSDSTAPSARKIPLWKQIAAVSALLFIVFLLFVIFEFPHLFSYITECLAILLIAIFSFLLHKSSLQERRGIFVFIAFCIFTVIASAGEMQTGSSMLIFIHQQIDHHILGFKIPISFFASLEPLSVISLAFLFSTLLKYLGYKKHVISPPYMVALGVLLTGLSFLLLSLSASISSMNGFNAPLYLLILANIIMGAGELCAIPMVMSAIESLAPKHLKAFFMGVFFMAFAFSGYFAGLMAMIGDTFLHSSTLEFTEAVYYRDFFGIVALIILLGALCAFMLAPQLKRMMQAR